MVGGPSAELRRDLDLIAGSGSVAGLGDAELLGRFAGRAGGEAGAAFEAIVARHGPMVRATCRRGLGDGPDADDAFQATFLVLVRRARAVRLGDGGSLGPWLHAVARRVAAKARARRGRLPLGIEADRLAAPGVEDARDRALDLGPALDEELGRLPERYRAPVVLCHLEGRSLAEAAALLRCPVGTVGGRLSRARAILRPRLARRGFDAPAVAAVLAAGEATAVPPGLLRATLGLAAGSPAPAPIHQLTRGVAVAMRTESLKIAGVVVASAAVALTAGVGYVSGRGQEPATKGAVPAAPVLTQGAAPGPDARPPGPPFAGLPPAGVPPTAVEIRAAHLNRVRDRAQEDLDAPKLAFGTAASNGVILVHGLEDLRTFRAMTLNMGTWSEYTAPPGVQAVVGLMAQGVAALAYSGTGVREIAVYDQNLGPVPAGEGPMVTTAGGWSRKALRTPADGDVVPVQAGGVIVYRVGDDIYTYDGPGSWSELHPAGEGPIVMQSVWGAILVRRGAAVHVYSIAGRRWIEDGPAGPGPKNPPGAK